MLLYEVIDVLERNAVIQNQILLTQRAPDFVFELICSPRMLNGNVAKLYAPDAGRDYIQTLLAIHRSFFASQALERTRSWVKAGDHVLDIGGHIGNHAIYWAGVAGAGRVYSYEPVASTRAIQQRNIALNQLEDVITSSPIALGEKPGQGSISLPDVHNSASVQVKDDGRGECMIQSLDALLDQGEFRDSTAISLVKIDVEGFEADVLRGGRRFFDTFTVDKG